MNKALGKGKFWHVGCEGLAMRNRKDGLVRNRSKFKFVFTGHVCSQARLFAAGVQLDWGAYSYDWALFTSHVLSGDMIGTGGGHN